MPAHFSRANNLGENLEVYVRPASLYRPEGAESANRVLRPPPPPPPTTLMHMYEPDMMIPKSSFLNFVAVVYQPWGSNFKKFVKLFIGGKGRCFRNQGSEAKFWTS